MVGIVADVQIEKIFIRLPRDGHGKHHEHQLPDTRPKRQPFIRNRDEDAAEKMGNLIKIMRADKAELLAGGKKIYKGKESGKADSDERKSRLLPRRKTPGPSHAHRYHRHSVSSFPEKREGAKT